MTMYPKPLTARRAYRLRELRKPLAHDRNPLFMGNGAGYFVIGYRTGQTPVVLFSSHDKIEVGKMRDKFEASLEGYERIAVEKATSKV